jgi:hypothetical protein
MTEEELIKYIESLNLGKETELQLIAKIYLVISTNYLNQNKNENQITD